MDFSPVVLDRCYSSCDGQVLGLLLAVATLVRSTGSRAHGLQQSWHPGSTVAALRL